MLSIGASTQGSRCRNSFGTIGKSTAASWEMSQVTDQKLAPSGIIFSVI
jgi:hypothetical protein